MAISIKAGKGATYREVDRDKYANNYNNIFKPKEEKEKITKPKK